MVDLSSNRLSRLPAGLLLQSLGLTNVDFSNNLLVYIPNDILPPSPNDLGAAPTMHTNELASCTGAANSGSITCATCTNVSLVVRAESAAQCCVEPAFPTCDSAFRFGLQPNVSFELVPPLLDVLFTPGSYRFEPALDKSALFRCHPHALCPAALRCLSRAPRRRFWLLPDCHPLALPEPHQVVHRQRLPNPVRAGVYIASASRRRRPD